MWTLALETTSAHPSLALLCGDQVVGVHDLEAQRTACTLFATLQALLSAQAMPLAAVDLFAVADGPGSFTGVRLGLAAVKGFVEVLGTAAVTISTLRAVAGVAGTPTLAALDAGRGEVYFGSYPDGEEGLEPVAAFRQRLQAAHRRAVTTSPELQALCPQLTLVPARLAAVVGQLGQADFHAGGALDALRLDARYLRRSDAELFAAAP